MNVYGDPFLSLVGPQIMVENGDKKPKSEDSFKYSSEYFNYHRNTMVFFSLCCLMSIFGLTPSFKEFLTEESAKNSAIFIPIILFACGAYSILMFIPEWMECAKPHRANQRNFVEKVDLSVEESINLIRSSKDNIETFRSLFENLKEQLELDKKQLTMALHFEFFSIAKSAVNTLNDNGMPELAMSIDDVQSLCDSDPGPLFSELVAMGLTEEQAELAHQRWQQYAKPHIARLDNAWQNLQQKIDEANQENDHNSMIINQRITDMQSNMSQNIERTTLYTKSLDSLSDRLNDILGLFKNAKKFARKDEKSIFIKTDIGGIWMTSAAAIFAFFGIIKFYYDYFSSTCLANFICTAKNYIAISP
ncbi:flagellar protein FlgN [Novosphingobium sp. ERN07]|uniref:flagellar protein FlgN n=1 Tax=Novosphingobium sp. ERN07 TaxID=2726187 RepID=UPI0014567A84|nr:flagellar protein FlgN [Novosphingobium sp. ERN07]NLR69556.1 flagellar protein FlgN [Novosphingobium sp. ERN07]